MKLNCDNVHPYITYIGSFKKKKKQLHREIKINVKNVHVLYFYTHTYLEFVNLVVKRKKHRNTLNTKNGKNAIHLRDVLNVVLLTRIYSLVNTDMRSFHYTIGRRYGG